MDMTSLSFGPLIAKGRTAEVFEMDEDRVIKLFYAWCPSRWVQKEIDISKQLASLPIPTPRIIDSLEINGRKGIIYERVNGPSMLRLTNMKPWLLLRLARQLAELHTEIHKQKVNGLPSLRTSLIETIQQLEDLPADLKSRVLQYQEGFPDGNILCHFDFHPDQVLLTDKGPVIIDWMTAQQGHPIADVARTCILLTFGQVPYGSWVMHAIVNTIRRLFYRAYLARYITLHPGISEKEIEKWMVPVAAARLGEGIPGEREPILRFIRSHLLTSQQQ